MGSIKAFPLGQFSCSTHRLRCRQLIKRQWTEENIITAQAATRETLVEGLASLKCDISNFRQCEHIWDKTDWPLDFIFVAAVKYCGSFFVGCFYKQYVEMLGITTIQLHKSLAESFAEHTCVHGCLFLETLEIQSSDNCLKAVSYAPSHLLKQLKYCLLFRHLEMPCCITIDGPFSTAHLAQLASP